jgi:hypothetical protein
MATEELPGVLFSNKPLRREAVSLVDLAPSILREFGLTVPPEMRGSSVLDTA